MKLYLAPDPDTGKMTVCPTQEAAKKTNKHGVQSYEVPTDKPGLMAFAQDAIDQIFDLQGQIRSLQQDASIAPVTIDAPPPVPTKAQPTPLTTQTIMEWLLDTATQPQVEQVFSAIGARWGETRPRT